MRVEDETLVQNHVVSCEKEIQRDHLETSCECRRNRPKNQIVANVYVFFVIMIVCGPRAMSEE